MKFIFFGTNQFSVGVLETLVAASLTPELIVTVPDDVAGRDKVLTPPFIKAKYQESGIKIIQPASLKDDSVISDIKSIGADFAVVAAYRKIIPRQLIEIFPKNILNVHPSLLPKWRGPSPIESAIWGGDKETGITIMLLDEQLDHGPILQQKKTKIGPQEYFYDLYLRLANLGGKLLVRTVTLWLSGQLTPLPQDHSQATLSKMLSWQDGKINLNKSAAEIYNQIRALSYEPGTWVELSQKSKVKSQNILKILKASLITNYLLPITALGLQEINKQLVLVCSDGALLLEQVQPQGKKVMTGKEFLNGYRPLLNVE